MGEAKRRKQINSNYGKARNAIYIDTIFLNRALPATWEVVSKLHRNLFSDSEISEKINVLNVSDLVPFLVEYAEKPNLVTGWPGLGRDQDIDVFVFRCLDFWRSVTVKPYIIGEYEKNYNIISKGEQNYNVQLLDVELVAPSIKLHIAQNQSFKKYKAISMVCNDRMYDYIIKEGILQGVSFMRYRLRGDEDRMTAPIGWQDIRYPIARTWGLEHHQL
jgi:hypothetical protein